MIVLGIETSCDETAAAVVRRDDEGAGRIVSNVVLSQDAHAIYGGVVPELAARAHVERLDDIIASALKEAGVTLADVDAIAATAGPGLIGGVLVGLTTAKAMAMATGKPLIAVNHLEAHALTARLTDGIAFPYLLLLVSGGHTQIVRVDGVGSYRRLGTTIDDALGEAFDKTAKLLDLGYPGGPAVERAAAKGDPTRFHLPRPMLGRPSPDFSFSGLKTAVRLEAEKHAPLSPQDVCDLCAAFQASICAVIADRVTRAFDLFRSETPDVVPTLVVAGGVAANKAIAATLKGVADKTGARLIVPPPVLCTDNGAMVAWVGAEKLALGQTDGFDVAARARWPLDKEAEPLVGHGRLGAKV
ncbi:t(6)A37 threonylcarbamoyladenosine biosynthesis protein [Hartmannibacter diazotrophicus]|uniref:tRNA N6-adenosine threonylcarbamoyltransferase n=1 Tax=Hartmannibacter diazotrophicus TaxID=1482074 RepID=A0A2C9D327_9HYPH|nr:tRNA (adenosine(37)-N6)-threonylcarbamoyltransferase complex transferase subunit TsaD [Hartmannibacter diazotrophicus]SON53875.1 t(6)A37 threonylcarbamoyladenosine biosynthesis protein [Hartmannibacter diazotrophicus]